MQWHAMRSFYCQVMGLLFQRLINNTSVIITDEHAYSYIHPIRLFVRQTPPTLSFLRTRQQQQEQHQQLQLRLQQQQQRHDNDNNRIQT